MAFLTRDELERLGFAALGWDVKIDDAARFYGAPHISLGSYVRIDAFSVLTAGPKAVAIGDHVHIGAGCYVSGVAGLRLDDFCGLSPRVAIFTTCDDFSGGALTNPTVPEDLRDVESAPVHLQKHALVGCGSVILPGVTVGVGASVGALSHVNKSVPEFQIVSGNPVRRVGVRSRDLLRAEEELRRREASEDPGWET